MGVGADSITRCVVSNITRQMSSCLGRFVWKSGETGASPGVAGVGPGEAGGGWGRFREVLGRSREGGGGRGSNGAGDGPVETSMGW